MLEATYTLANGVQIPKIGFGTWMIDADADAAKAVHEAIDAGYRHIDTAEAYGNEVGVGEGVRASGIGRKDIFVNTKLAAEIKNHDEAVKAIDDSLQKLNLDYIDMMIIHAPKPWAKYDEPNRYFEGNLEAWRALEEAYKAGKLRAIGVSNFDPTDWKISSSMPKSRQWWIKFWPTSRRRHSKRLIMLRRTTFWLKLTHHLVMAKCSKTPQFKPWLLSTTFRLLSLVCGICCNWACYHCQKRSTQNI